VEKVSLLPTSTTSQELNFFSLIFLGRNQFVLVIYGKNVKSKRLVKKRYSQSTNMCYFGVCLWKSFSLQPTLTPSQWLKSGPFAMKFLSQDELHVNDKCGKIQAQKSWE
jgi:hypothetical protein